MTTSRVLFVALALAGTTLLTATPAWAQVPPGDEAVPVQPANAVQTYIPLDFAAFAPRSALDMLRQLPGFTIDGGGAQGRGLGQASGNVLLNGERLVSKSDTIEQQIGRIPADNVIRIEVVDGSTLSIPGLSGRVANIIARSTGGVQGQFEWRPQLAGEYSGSRLKDGTVSLSGRTGALTFTLAAASTPFRGGSGGPNTFTFGDGRVEERFNISRSFGDGSQYSARLGYALPGGAVANMSGSYTLNRFRSTESELTLGPAGAPPFDESLSSRNRGHEYELGADVTFDLGPGKLKLIGLEAFTSGNSTTQAVVDRGNGSPTGSRFANFTESGERIGRGEFGWSMLGGEWQLSGEAAFNRLARQSSLEFLAPNGVFNPIPFPGGTGGVTEDRYEALLSVNRPITSRMSFQLILGGENSTLAQTGANPLSRTFRRPKGSLNLAWVGPDGLNLSLRLDRRVGQLNFGDFLAAVNLTQDNENAGNNQLRPDQSWGAELEFAKTFGTFVSTQVRLFSRFTTDFVTVVPLPGGGESTGNIDSARVVGVEMDTTVQLDSIGLAGARVDLRAQLRDSHFEDPVLGGSLPMQFAQPRNVELDFRHDPPASDWAYGANFRSSAFNPYHRLSERGLDYNIPENLIVFVEHKDVFGLTVQGRVSNILEGKTVLDRSVFAGPRGIAPLAFREFRRRQIGRTISFTVKGSF